MGDFTVTSIVNLLIIKSEIRFGCLTTHGRLYLTILYSVMILSESVSLEKIGRLKMPMITRHLMSRSSLRTGMQNSASYIRLSTRNKAIPREIGEAYLMAQNYYS